MLQYGIVTYRNEKSTKIKTSAQSQVWECAPEGFQRATGKPFGRLRRGETPASKSKFVCRKYIPKSKKIAIGQAIRSRWQFSYAFTFPKLSGISTTKCGWHDKSPADTRSSGSSSAFSGYRRRKSVTGAIGHDAFASVL